MPDDKYPADLTPEVYARLLGELRAVMIETAEALLGGPVPRPWNWHALPVEAAQLRAERDAATEALDAALAQIEATNVELAATNVELTELNAGIAALNAELAALRPPTVGRDLGARITAWQARCAAFYTKWDA